MACAIGYEDAVRALLEVAHADVNAKDTTYDQTPLMWAARMGHEAVVKQLLHNCDVDVNGKDTKYGLTSLSWAVVRKHKAAVKHLLNDERVDRNCKSSSGWTPLSFAIEGQTEILTLLLEKGAEVNIIYKKVGRSDFGRML